MRLSVTVATLAVHYFNSNDENICELFKLDVSLSWLPFSSVELPLEFRSACQCGKSRKANLLPHPGKVHLFVGKKGIRRAMQR